MRLTLEQHGGVHEDFGDSRQGALEAAVEKEIDERILLGILVLFVHGWCCSGLSTFSIQPWTDAYNPGGSGAGRRATALAADSATLHRLPVRRTNASCGLLQTNLYTPSNNG